MKLVPVARHTPQAGRDSVVQLLDTRAPQLIVKSGVVEFTTEPEARIEGGDGDAPFSDDGPGYRIDTCPEEWPVEAFNLLVHFIFKVADVDDLRLAGAPVSAEFTEEWQRLWAANDYRRPTGGGGGRGVASAGSASTGGESGSNGEHGVARGTFAFTQQVVMTLDDLAKSLGVEDDAHLALRAHKARRSLCRSGASLRATPPRHHSVRC